MTCAAEERKIINGSVTIQRLNEGGTQFLFSYWIKAYSDQVIASDTINYIGRPVPTRYQELLDKYDEQTQWLLDEIQQLLIEQAEETEEALIIGYDIKIQKANEGIQNLVKKRLRIETKINVADKKNKLRYLKRCEMYYKRFYDRLLAWQLKHLYRVDTIAVNFASLQKAQTQYLELTARGY